jgi:hypothetical protein
MRPRISRTGLRIARGVRRERNTPPANTAGGEKSILFLRLRMVRYPEEDPDFYSTAVKFFNSA